MLRNRSALVFLLVVVSTISTSCASRKQGRASNVESENLARIMDEGVTVQTLSERLSRLKEQKAQFIAPQPMASAEVGIKVAGQALERGETENYNSAVRTAHENLNRAERLLKLNRIDLQPLLEARATAVQVNASQLPEFTSLEREYVYLTSKLDGRSRAESLKEIPRLTDQYSALARTTVDHQFLSEARENLKTAAREGAAKRLPATFASAERSVETARDFIAKDPLATPMITQLATQARFETERLVNLNRQAQSLARLSDEDRVLRVEGMIAAVSSATGSQDLRNRNFETQISETVAQIQNLKMDQEQMSQKAQQLELGLNEQTRTIQSLSERAEQVKALEGTQGKLERFRNIRALFSPDEAEVISDGDRIIIRLKGIKFASGNAQIASENFPLLHKVSQAVALTDKPSIVIEGHTDSTGSGTLNRELSQERATAVMGYLKSLSNFNDLDIVAIGKGAESPVASNRTAQGRAMNRRIDILLNP